MGQLNLGIRSLELRISRKPWVNPQGNPGALFILHNFQWNDALKTDDQEICWGEEIEQGFAYASVVDSGDETAGDGLAEGQTLGPILLQANYDEGIIVPQEAAIVFYDDGEDANRADNYDITYVNGELIIDPITSVPDGLVTCDSCTVTVEGAQTDAGTYIEWAVALGVIGLAVALLAFGLAAACVFGAATLTNPSVGLPQAIAQDSPCPATGCASGTCHGYENVPEPDGVHAMVCPEAGCTSTECHAWDQLRSGYRQASDASLNLWILVPILTMAALAALVRKESRQ